MTTDSHQAEIDATEAEIFRLTQKLAQLRKQADAVPVENYVFSTQTGDRSLSELFADKERLLLIHNMGQGCRYCTLWADGLNGFLPHLESALSVVVVSKDHPEAQRKFANSRGWRFRMASHGGGAYIKEQTVLKGELDMPGCVVYTKQGEAILRTSSAVFGPGDLYCSAWNFLALAGLGTDQFTPQFDYWQRPAQLDDGGENLI